MINTNRIVPVQAIDLISLYSTILKMNSNNSTLTKVSASTPNGDFDIASASVPLLCDEPVSTCDLASTISSAVIHFVPAYDYSGFTQGGEPITQTGDVDADGCSLYVATLSSGSISIGKVGL